MNEQTGWLLDVYADAEDGLVLWLLTDDDQRLRLRMKFPVTVYTAGEFALLRQAWVYLKDKDVKLERTTRRDLFLGERDVMAITLFLPSLLPALFADLSRQFPSLDYYDADIPLSLRFIAQTNTHLLGRCHIVLDDDTVQAIQSLDSPWEVEPAPLPLSILTLSPDINPAIRKPKYLHVQTKQTKYKLSLEPRRAFLISLISDLQRFDPDLILTDYGDTWLFSQLEVWAKECGIEFNPNRDESKEVLKTRPSAEFLELLEKIYDSPILQT